MGKRRLTVLWLTLGCLLFAGCSSTPPSSPSAPQPVPEPTKPQAQVVEVLSEADIVKIGELYGPTAEARVRHWQQLIRGAGALTEPQKLQQVNRFFNGARFVDDEIAWRQSDYWATPLEFLVRDAGDCEDFTIAKYFTLEKMGIEPDKMRLTFVRAASLNKAHMVLSYYPHPDAEPLILDNIELQILPASQRQDLRPVYSFNGDDLWLAKTRIRQQQAGNADTIKHWKALKDRQQAGVPVIPRTLLSGQ